MSGVDLCVLCNLHQNKSGGFLVPDCKELLPCAVILMAAISRKVLVCICTLFKEVCGENSIFYHDVHVQESYAFSRPICCKFDCGVGIVKVF